MASNQTSADRERLYTPPAAAPPTPVPGTAQATAAATSGTDPGRDYLIGLSKQNGTYQDSSGLTGVSAAAAQYPAFASLMAIPEVADLLNQASVAGWSNDQFTLHLMATNWWKSQSDTERVWEATKLSDPAKAAQQKNQMYTQVATEAQLLGVALDTNQLNLLAEGAIGQGWNATQVQQAIAGNAQQFKDTAGNISATQNSLQGIAAQYALPMSSATTFDWAKKVAQGQTDQASFTDYAKQQAKVQHPYWQKQLDEGLTVRQLADPYIQTAASTLEISPDSVDLSDPKWQKALSGTQNAQGQTTGPMSQLAWKTTLMQDPTYNYQQTDQARQAAFTMVDQLGKTFGESA